MTKKKPKRLLVELTPEQGAALKRVYQGIEKEPTNEKSLKVVAKAVVEAIKQAEKRSKTLPAYGDGYDKPCDDCPGQ